MKTALNILGSLTLLAAGVASAAPGLYNLEFAENPPFTMVESGKEKGVAIDVIQKLFEKAGLKYQLHMVPLARGMDDARTKANTCVFPVQRAQSNEAEYLWVSPIFVINSGFFTHPDMKNEFQVMAGAKKLKVGALRGSGDAEYLKSFGFLVEETNTQDQNVKKLLNKAIDVWATDTLSATYFMKQQTSTAVDISKVYIFRRSLGSLACNTRVPNADINKLQTVLDSMIKDGSLQKLTMVP